LTADEKQRKLRVAIIGTVGLPPKYGGFETLAQYLVEYLGTEFDFTVYCSGPDYDQRPDRYLGARLKYIPFRANGPQSVVFDGLSIIDACFHCDVLLVLGVSGGIFLPFASLLSKKVVVNVDGIDWARSKWNRFAQSFLRFSEKVAVRSSEIIISDNGGIAAYVQQSYGRDSDLIEYGGDQVSIPQPREAVAQKYPFVAAPYAFSVARIQADNNVQMILEAFSRTPQWPLVFVGNWDRSDYGRALKQHFEDHPNLHLLEAIYDQDELNGLRGHCALYIHGHSAGGTNPSLVEAMNLALPIAAFDVIYNRETTEGRARYFRSADELVRVIEETPREQWERMRADMKAIAERRYTWRAIAAKYKEVLARPT
jgi:glycosyltransferase involved in cell wall biosynthesis